jgi:RNA 3'-terminal phosphate cyclase
MFSIYKMSAVADKRVFKVQGSTIGFKGGRYTGKTPVQAAKKAAKSLFKRLDTQGAFAKYKDTTKIKLMIRETTRGHVNDVYYYEATRDKLSTPIIIQRNGVTVEIKYDYKLKTCEKF